jgi:hypothetical protein
MLLLPLITLTANTTEFVEKITRAQLLMSRVK